MHYLTSILVLIIVIYICQVFNNQSPAIGRSLILPRLELTILGPMDRNGWTKLISLAKPFLTIFAYIKNIWCGTTSIKVITYVFEDMEKELFKKYSTN